MFEPVTSQSRHASTAMEVQGRDGMAGVVSIVVDSGTLGGAYTVA